VFRVWFAQTTFAAYWGKALRPGGFYFVEDTHVGRKAPRFFDPANPVRA
jgi:hypothetical protein